MSGRIRGEAVGQNESRCSRLRGLVDRYPEDSGILKELVQNADDGRAREVKIIFDDFCYKPDSSPAESLQQICGPAVIAWNDKPFEEQDFNNLSRLANSAKVEDASKTGRFGLGFNSVYNITDFPMLLTRTKLWCLDPCETLLDSREGGERWDLGQLAKEQVNGILTLFEPVGYSAGCVDFPATAFRLPLRTQEHVELNGDPDRPGKPLISSKTFDEDAFEGLVEGFSAIAHELLLFLKNVESISCSHRDSSGSLQSLLEISVRNRDDVQAGRARINELLCSGLDASIEACAASAEHRVETSYEVQIEVIKNGSTAESSAWRVVSGLYAGEESELVEASERLHRIGERGLPHAGVAICLEKNGEPFPEIESKLFCYLPIAGSEYSGHFPVHIHGAFSLDDSRTSLTGHREDEHGKVAEMAKWNDLLLEHGVAQAYANALTELTALPDAPADQAELAAIIYGKCPSLRSEGTRHHHLLAKSALRFVADSHVFLDATGTWRTLDDIIKPPSDPKLRDCLVAEQFPVLNPSLPSKLVSSLESAGKIFPVLTTQHIKGHFVQDGPGSWAFEEAPFAGLSNRDAVAAVTRFLVNEKESGWERLPLAVTSDGKLQTFSDEDDPCHFIATERQRRIFSAFPEWFLDPDFVTEGNLAEAESECFRSLNVEDILDRLERMIPHEEATPSDWVQDGEEPPNAEWLVEVLQEINDSASEENDAPDGLKKVPIIPGDDDRLHFPGSPSTPLFIPWKQRQLGEILKPLDVRFWLLDPNGILTQPLSEFRKKFNLVGNLTPPDLIDNLGGKSDDLIASADEWRNEAVVSRLLKFLESGVGGDKLTEEHAEILKRLPLFPDIEGKYGSIDETTYLTGAFDLPDVVIPARLLSVHDHARLLEFLGVEEITRKDLLGNCVIPSLAQLSDESLVGIMKWVRDQWNYLVEDFGDAESLVEVMADEPCLISEDGERRSPRELYHPVARDLVLQVLGENAFLPDPEKYEDPDEYWSQLFKYLELADAPRAQDLVNLIEIHVEEIEESSTLDEPEAQVLIQIFKHVQKSWDSLREEQIEILNEEKQTLAEYLQSKAWIPPLRINDGAERFGAWKEPECRLYQLEELLLVSQGCRAGSVRAFFPVDSRTLPSKFQSDLGIQRLPTGPEICEHLRNVIQRVGEGPFEKGAKQIARVFGEIYQGLGELHKAGVSSDDPEEVQHLSDLCEAFAAVRCVLFPSAKRLYPPCDVYRSAPPSLAPLKVSYQDTNEQVEAGLRLLGRKDEPEIRSLAQTLVDRSTNREYPLTEDELAAALACLREIQHLAEEASEQLDDVDIRLPNQEGYLLSHGDLVFDNSHSLSGQLQLKPSFLLQSDAPPYAKGVYRVSRLTEASASPVGSQLRSTDERFNQRCADLETTVSSSEFSNGLSRILQHEDTAPIPAEFAWLRSVDLEAYANLTCSYAVKLSSGETLELGEASSGVAFDPDAGEVGAFLISEQDLEFLDHHFANELARTLDSQAPTDLSCLIKMLKYAPDEIDHVLDELGVSRWQELQERSDGLPVEAATCSLVEDAEESQEERAESAEETSRSEPTEAATKDSQEAQASEKPSRTQSEQPDNAEKESTPSAPSKPRDQQPEKDEEESIHNGDKRKSSSGQSQSYGKRGSGPRQQSDGDSPSKKGKKRGRMEKGGNSTSGSKQGKAKPSKRKGRMVSYVAREDPSKKEDPFEDQRRKAERAARAHAIGRKATDWVIKFERQQGRRPQEMAQGNPGYDIESRKGRGVVDRYIEIKGTDEEWGERGVGLSDIQFDAAEQYRESFWLYVVENVFDEDCVTIYTIPNPFQKVTHYQFDLGWKKAAKDVHEFEVVMPRYGDSVVDEQGRKAKIEKTSYREKDRLVLTVKYEDGQTGRIDFDVAKHQVVKD